MIIGETYLSRITLCFPKSMQLSDDEFFDFAQANPDLKMERDRFHHVILMALTGGKTGNRNAEITAELTLWNRVAQLGVVFDSSTGFCLPNGAVRSPDAAFVTLERWNALTDEQQTKFPPLCPDFVVELMSTSDDLADADAKMQEYLENGARLGWLLSPKTVEARIYKPNEATRVVTGFTQSLSGEDVMPNFTLDLNLLR